MQKEKKKKKELKEAYIWLTSNKLAFSRVHLWLSMCDRSSYCSGISKPAYGTILAPRATCKSYNGVRFSGPVALDDAYRTGDLFGVLLPPMVLPARYGGVLLPLLIVLTAWRGAARWW